MGRGAENGAQRVEEMVSGSGSFDKILQRERESGERSAQRKFFEFMERGAAFLPDSAPLTCCDSNTIVPA
jgi:hypothetical protein